MRLFDDEERINRILAEFQKVDEFYDAFKTEFISAICELIKLYHADFKRDKLFDEMLNQYAITVLSVTQTVLDKDSVYPEYRKKEDLAAMHAYASKAVDLQVNKELAEKTHLKTKELLVRFYPQIIDLSADGFRLLELNLSLFNLEFIANFNRMSE